MAYFRYINNKYMLYEWIETKGKRGYDGQFNVKQ